MIWQVKLKIQSVDLVTKNSKEIVDNLLKSVYDANVLTVCLYEKDIVQIMVDLNCSLVEALEVDFDMNSVDKSSVVTLVDYLEYRLKGDLDKVNLLMQVYTGNEPDFKLVKL